ncbi:M48 family metalloprotease [Candidatus Nomurabacteria bacterium]|uniref:Protease HtpX homolog n=1 Tax=Candidatus Dojkabacteria bacterium TaxID=2099670 RepID=A0A955KY56_9BACT|nr:M48 family metalloprotease [Candidatus Dojkabacteria bacterium]MCB9790260.1 M48 family metalloprotease [Candidatus Nomurabacteria bacterium]MCB9803219.1 M48 family metalloprotease [Candidatus Nomurabacteria bacterium]
MNIFSNYSKTAFLLGALSALLILIAYLFGGDASIIPMLLISVSLNLAIYFYSDRVAIASAKAKKAQRSQFKDLYRSMEKLSVAFDIPTPELYISPERTPNAFATGRNPSNAVVCLTQGLIDTLPLQEIEGVIAHEMSHIKNRDTLIATMAAVIASIVSTIPRMAIWFGSGSRDNDSSDGIAQLITIILAPFLAMLLQLAITRSREYSADEMAARNMGSALPLAHALRTISTSTNSSPTLRQDPVFASLYISSPKQKQNKLSEIFSTHLPTEKRIERLMSLQF